jgi:hypothetical protein
MPDIEGGGENPVLPISEGDKNHNEQGWYNKPYEALVADLKRYISQQQQLHKGDTSPEQIIRNRLALESRSPIKENSGFFRTLRLAYNVLSYARAEPGSAEEREIGFDVDWASNVGPEPLQAVKLTDPVQVRALDAFAEATGIPHKRGQTEIPIPDKLKDYSSYVLSQEYRHLVAQAQVRRTSKRPR